MIISSGVTLHYPSVITGVHTVEEEGRRESQREAMEGWPERQKPQRETMEDGQSIRSHGLKRYIEYKPK